MSEERRKSKRFRSPGIKSNLSDGDSVFVVAVDDVSKTGLGVSQVPEGFDESVHPCFTVINTPLEDFTLILHPRWVDPGDHGKYKRIGFHIDDPPTEWVDFVKTLKGEPDKEKQRDATRHKLLGMMAVISDGKSRYFGVVENLSKNGLRLTQVAADFAKSAESCAAVVRSPTGDVHVSLHPCWFLPTHNGMYKTIGFKIQSPPPGWLKMIEDLDKSHGKFNFMVIEDDEGASEDHS